MKRAVGFTFVALAITACSIGETNYERVTYPIREAKETSACNSPFVDVDVTKLKECGAGKGHCYAIAKVGIPPEQIDPCEAPGEYCIPDKVLKANGKEPTKCKWSKEEPGGCVPRMFKEVEKNSAFLQKDACDDDELCAPCINPLTNADAHVCEPNGVHEKECTTGAAEDGEMESCCHNQGVCVKPESIPGDSAGDMEPDSCSDGQLCAPAAMIDGNPTKCELPLGFDGVCVNVCFAKMLGAAEKVLGSGCQATEICMPCLIGKGQGMPGCE